MTVLVREVLETLDPVWDENPDRAISGPSCEKNDLSVLFRKYSGMVFRICMRYTKNREDAEDMVSEVFLKVNASLHKYRGESKPMVWIYRIAVNQCLDLLRSKRSRKEFDVDDLDFLRGAPVHGAHGDQCQIWPVRRHASQEADGLPDELFNVSLRS